MQVQLPEALQEKLARAAAKQGRERDALVVEALEHFLEHDDWFQTEVERGIAAGDSGRLIDHDEVKKLINLRYPV